MKDKQPKENYLVFKGVHHELTESIIGLFFDVYNTLGYGFLEKVYENALIIALRKQGLHVVQQQGIRVYYEGEVAGTYYADIIVERKVILEIKVAEKISEAHIAQLDNYLRATDAQVGLVLNFGRKPEFRRRIHSNKSKPHHTSIQQEENPRKSA